MSHLHASACLSVIGLTLVLGGCQPINNIYKQDTGEVAVVPGPPPDTVSSASDSGEQVAFIEPGNEDAALDAETDAIEPLPEPEPEPEPEPVAEVRTYTIQKGDNYWKIAQSVYGDPMKMKDIEAANPGVDPKKLQIGDEIVLP